MTMAEAGRAIASLHFSRLVAAEEGTVAGRDPEALHDMRVATRRLRAAFRVFRAAYDPAVLAALDSEVRWLAGLLGRVRDSDVLTDALSAYEQAHTGGKRASLAWLLAEVYAARAAERVALVEGLRSPRYGALKGAMVAILGDDSGSPDAQTADLRRHAERAIRRQLKSLRKAGRAARAGFAHPQGNEERLHALRIAAKRLRYTMEFFADLFPPDLQAAIAAATAVQDHLGAMRDAQLQTAWVAKVVRQAERSDAEKRAARGLLRHLQRRQEEELRAAAAAYQALVSKESRRQLRELLQASAPDALPDRPSCETDAGSSSC